MESQGRYIIVQEKGNETECNRKVMLKTVYTLDEMYRSSQLLSPT